MSELKDQRVVTMMSPSELQAIDDWMFSIRVKSRGEAIRRLCRIGLLWDRGAEDLRLEVIALRETLDGEFQKVLDLVDDRAEDDPAKFNGFAIACLEMGLKVADRVSALGDQLYVVGPAAEMMKLEGSLEGVTRESILAQARGIANRAEHQLERFRRDNPPASLDETSGNGPEE